MALVDDTRASNVRHLTPVGEPIERVSKNPNLEAQDLMKQTHLRSADEKPDRGTAGNTSDALPSHNRPNQLRTAGDGKPHIDVQTYGTELAGLLRDHKDEDFGKRLQEVTRDFDRNSQYKEVTALVQFIDELNAKYRKVDNTISDVVVKGFQADCGPRGNDTDWVTNVYVKTPGSFHGLWGSKSTEVLRNPWASIDWMNKTSLRFDEPPIALDSVRLNCKTH